MAKSKFSRRRRTSFDSSVSKEKKAKEFWLRVDGVIDDYDVIKEMVTPRLLGNEKIELLHDLETLFKRVKANGVLKTYSDASKYLSHLETFDVQEFDSIFERLMSTIVFFEELKTSETVVSGSSKHHPVKFAACDLLIKKAIRIFGKNTTADKWVAAAMRSEAFRNVYGPGQEYTDPNTIGDLRRAINAQFKK